MSINYSLLADAIEFYKLKGYKLIEVPWTVSPDAHNATFPDRSAGLSVRGHLIGSAEQGFLELIKQGQLGPGKYQALSPCFRDDPEDEIHQKQFMKLELIHVGSSEDSISQDALSLFAPMFGGNVALRGGDIVTSAGVELGSYGVRTFQCVPYAYGTGLAEPRCSYAFQEHRGYHDTPIVKFPYGTRHKLLEEVREYLETKNSIIAACELADILGTIQAEACRRGLQLQDLIDLAEKTGRAFNNGRR